jgi:hypothetical protein
MFGLLRYDRKANSKKPERQKERTLEHAELKAKSQQTPVKFVRKSKPLTILSCEAERNISEELLEMRSREPEIFRFAQDDKRVRTPIRFNFLTTLQSSRSSS